MIRYNGKTKMWEVLCPECSRMHTRRGSFERVLRQIKGEGCDLCQAKMLSEEDYDSVLAVAKMSNKGQAIGMLWDVYNDKKKARLAEQASHGWSD